jgi:hypothetical protein
MLLNVNRAVNFAGIFAGKFAGNLLPVFASSNASNNAGILETPMGGTRETSPEPTRKEAAFLDSLSPFAFLLPLLVTPVDWQ